MAPELGKHPREDHSDAIGDEIIGQGTTIPEVGASSQRVSRRRFFLLHIEDERLSFHAQNQDKCRTSVHRASAGARVPRPRRDKAPVVERIIVPSSFTQGLSDHAKKLTESLPLVRQFGSAHYFLTFTCSTVSTFISSRKSSVSRYYNMKRIPYLIASCTSYCFAASLLAGMGRDSKYTPAKQRSIAQSSARMSSSKNWKGCYR